MTSSIIINEGKPDEECGELSSEYYANTVVWGGIL
jgi:hypothetical protein